MSAEEASESKSEKLQVDTPLVAAPERKPWKPPSPWAQLTVAVIALVVSITSATFTAFNYFRSDAGPNTLVVSKSTKDHIEKYYTEADDLYRQLLSVPKTISADDYKLLQQEVDRWGKEAGHYIQAQLPATEYRRLVDANGSTGMAPDLSYPEPIATDRAQELTALILAKRNLQILLDRMKVK